ncbi:hypothetical protein FA15DRAFT_670287 [Coprinopsis marcescibilis]|uniref:Ubiquitin-like domain-containing protein n=1 Tax=Coprinopsis marcescibilis TaxID=230819 RepID=A0A5C3KTT5_COPMA|nr:hypothetical protein FA15DRAFT_670287 [Coprinopsis marcescibilis]
MSMLSEKAKGKQKALDDPSDKNAPSTSTNAEPPTRELVIRFTEGAPDLTVIVTKQHKVLDLKRKIRTIRPELKDHRLRLIHSGRLLTDGTFVYSWLTSLEERQQRAALANGDGKLSSKASTTWIHCSVGPKFTSSGDEVEENRPSGQMQPLRGFDRLSGLGFSEADIVNFRRQFHSQSMMNYLDLDFETEEEFDEHARALEEQWIDSIDNAGSAALSQSANSSNASILQGIVIGFFFPLLPFFFLRSKHAPVFWEDGSEHEHPANVIFSRKTQMGLVVGFLINLMFGLWRFLLDSS